jgi:hypothetical protein
MTLSGDAEHTKFGVTILRGVMVVYCTCDG